MRNELSRFLFRVAGAVGMSILLPVFVLAGQSSNPKTTAPAVDPQSAQPQSNYPRVLNQGLQDPLAMLDQFFADPFIGDPFFGDPFEEMRRMRAQMNQLFSQNFGALGMAPSPSGRLGPFPNVSDLSMGLGSAELTEDGDNYIVTMPIDDSKKLNFNVRVDGARLMITSTESSQRVRTDEKGNTMQSESHGEYSQMISLPGPVDQNRMKIEQDAGVLRITLPKSNAPSNTTSPSPLPRTSTPRQIKTT